MRKMLLMLTFLTFGWATIAAASGGPNVSKHDIFGTDSLIYLNGNTQSQPMILHRGIDHFTLIPNGPQPTPPTEKSPLLDPPPNDNCASAIPIGDVDSLAFNAVDATFDGPGGAIITPDIWYLYTASTTGPIQIDVLANPNDYPMIAVYNSSSCPVYEPPPTPTPLQGSEQMNHVPLIGALPVAYTGTLIGHTQDHVLPCAFQNNAPDVFYKYIATSNDPITVSLCPSDTMTWPPLLGILDVNGNDLACSQDYDWPQTQILNFPVTQGETYYIEVSACLPFFRGVGYTLEVTSPAYDMMGFSSTRPSDVQRLDFDAVEGQQYLIELGSRAAGQLRYTLTDGFLFVGPAPTPPENDDCVNATDGGILHPAEPIQFTGDNTGATLDCSVISDFPDIWIKFTTEDTMDVRIDYCGNPTITNDIMGTMNLSNACPCNPYCEVRGGMDVSTPFLPCPNSVPPSVPIFAWYNLPPGTYWYPMLVISELEGPYAINITGSVFQECANDAIFGQRPTTPTLGESFNFANSEVESHFAAADHFSSAPTDSITQITWWGVNVDSMYNSCESESYPFQIIFCHDNHGLPGDTVAAYDVVASRQETGYLLSGLYQEKFIAALDPPLVMTDGWLIIRGNSEDNCNFMWQNSVLSGGLEYDDTAQTWTALGFNLAFCLDGVSGGSGSCVYVVGDANGSNSFNGLDVTYSVGYFKGGQPPPYSCECTPGHTWYVAGDVNASCTFNGLDVTYAVSYFKGGPAPHPCPDCPPAGLLAPYVPGGNQIPLVEPMTTPTIKTKGGIKIDN